MMFRFSLRFSVTTSQIRRKYEKQNSKSFDDGSRCIDGICRSDFYVLKVYLYTALLGAASSGCIAGAMNCNSLNEKE